MFTACTQEKLCNYIINNLDISFQCKTEIYSEKENAVTDVIGAYLWMNNKQTSRFTFKDQIDENPNHKNLLGSFPPAFKQKFSITNGISESAVRQFS